MAGRSDGVEERGMDAAERALGTEASRPPTPEDARAERDWALRLAPLAEMLTPVAPPPGLFARIEARIEAEEREAAREALLARTRRRLAGWRAAALAFGVGAAAAAGWLAAGPVLAPPPGPAERYLAVATAGGGGPAVVVEVDLARGVATVRPVGVAAPETGVLELWLIEEGEAPRSLGLMDAAAPVERAIAASPGDVIAVTLEPPGGAPGGNPSGPPILSGPLVPEP